MLDIHKSCRSKDGIGRWVMVIVSPIVSPMVDGIYRPIANVADLEHAELMVDTNACKDAAGCRLKNHLLGNHFPASVVDAAHCAMALSALALAISSNASKCRTISNMASTALLEWIKRLAAGIFLHVVPILAPSSFWFVAIGNDASTFPHATQNESPLPT